MARLRTVSGVRRIISFPFLDKQSIYEEMRETSDRIESGKPFDETKSAGAFLRSLRDAGLHVWFGAACSQHPLAIGHYWKSLKRMSRHKIGTRPFANENRAVRQTDTTSKVRGTQQHLPRSESRLDVG